MRVSGVALVHLNDEANYVLSPAHPDFKKITFATIGDSSIRIVR